MTGHASSTSASHEAAFFGRLSTVKGTRRQSLPRRTASEAAGRKLPGKVYRTKSVSDILDTNDDFHKDFFSQKASPHLHRQTCHTQDDSSTLINFLKNQPPPPSNFMSIPDKAEADERGRWMSLRKMAKRSKSMPREAPRIQLPDSAISGTTSGGHRYIAISIPMKACPFGTAPRSQYPIYSSRDPKMSSSRHSFVRTVKDEKGTVTVLRPVKEVGEGPISAIAQPEPTSHQPRSATLSRVPSSGDRYYGTLGRSGAGFHGVVPDHEIVSTEEREEQSRKSALARHPTQDRRETSLARSASTGCRSLGQNISIDGRLRQRHSGNAWPLKAAASSQVRASWPDQPAADAHGLVYQENGAEILTENPLVARSDMSEPQTPTSTKSRKDRVRDRKRRDMEAQRVATTPRSTTSGTPLAGSSMRVSTLSPIQVVVNLAPESPSDNSRQESSAKRSTHRISSVTTDTGGSRKRYFATSSPASSSCGSTPSLTDDNGSPPQRPISLDRTSLSRRREWKSTREQQRKSEDSRAAVKQRAKELIAEAEKHDNDPTSKVDKEILRLYETYRDQRFREMERRVRRLERHGDVWLRALVPVLEELNQTMVSSRHGNVGETRREWSPGNTHGVQMHHQHRLGQYTS